ncbi:MULTISPECIES: hypothetical protein [unclassified Serratia (in: enterobacteria)]|uniref:hypothetical protein n=1 Tax=unclassified Serratia (in: enterobacteria) TaxID=2647522 RepID=UPI003076572D
MVGSGVSLRFFCTACAWSQVVRFKADNIVNIKTCPVCNSPVAHQPAPALKSLFNERFNG